MSESATFKRASVSETRPKREEKHKIYQESKLAIFLSTDQEKILFSWTHTSSMQFTFQANNTKCFEAAGVIPFILFY